MVYGKVGLSPTVQPITQQQNPTRLARCPRLVCMLAGVCTQHTFGGYITSTSYAVDPEAAVTVSNCKV